MPERPENGYVALVIGCLCLLAIIGLVSWTVPYSKGYQAADNDHQAAYAEHNRAEEHYEKCSAESSVSEALKCYQNAENRDRDQQASEQDLDAQREMANWAEGMLWAAIILGCLTFSITALGVYWVRDTLLATRDAVMSANEANQIMRDQGARYLIVEKVEAQFREMGLFLKATVKNIGQRPVRTGSLRGKITVNWFIRQNDGTPSHQLRRFSVELFVGVVEPTKTATGYEVVLWSNITDDPDTYRKEIQSLDGNGLDFDCFVSWTETTSRNTVERHIMNVRDNSDFIDPNLGNIFILEVGYSGMHRDLEEKNAAKHGS